MLKSRSAYWFFFFLLGAGALSAVIPFLYATFRQLDSETVAKAKARWEDRKPLDYNLTVRHDFQTPQIFRVRVRGGKVQETLQDGSFENVLAVHQVTISGIFEQLAALADSKTRSDYLIADFHPVMGFPVRIVWRKSGGTREEWVIRLDASP